MSNINKPITYTYDNQIYTINPARIPIDMAKHGINYEQAIILQAIQRQAEWQAERQAGWRSKN